LCVIGLIIVPSLIILVSEVLRKPEDAAFRQHIIYSVRSAYNSFVQHALFFVFLPYDAWINFDAIVRTLWRLFISRKKFLQWNPYGNSSANTPKNFWSAYRAMWFEPLLALTLLGYLFYYSSLALIIEIPVLILWTIAPAIERLVSIPYSKREAALSMKQQIFLRKLSSKIWAFF